MTSLIDVSLEEESATGQRDKMNKNRTGTTEIFDIILGSSKRDFWAWPDENSSS